MFKLYRLIKRIFEPAIKTKVSSIKLMIEGTFDYLWWDLIPIISIPILIKYLNNQDYERIKYFSILLIVLYVFLWIIHVFMYKWQFKSLYAMSIYVERKYLKQVLLKDNVAIEKVGTGKIQSIVKNGLDDWVKLNHEIIGYAPRTVFGLLTGVYIISNFSFKYVPYFLLIIFLSGLAFYYLKKIVLKYDEKVNDINNQINKDYVRVIMSRQEIIFANQEMNEVNNISTLLKKQMSIDVNSAKYGFLAELSIGGTLILLPVIGVLFFALNFPLNATNIAFLISFIYFCSRFSGTMYPMVWIIRKVFECYPKIKTFWEFLDKTPVLSGYDEGEKLISDKGEIELKGVYLLYENREILKDFNMKIEARQKIALIGRSGSGKTTIAKLISGFMKPTSGQVLIDGQDLSTVSLKSFYKRIGYLTQEPMVFDGTIKDNLLYSIVGKGAVSDQKLLEVLKLAECDFITDLNTQIGEKGIRLSGGERQRLAIAKLMLKNPEIIILDEPTSALDSFSEDSITRALDKLFENKTVIIIAHRLQTVRKADKIYVIENGKIIEEGDHHDLKEKEGQYKKMLDLQVGE